MSTVSDLPPDEERLMVLETFLVIMLARVREQLTHVRRQAAIHRKSELQRPSPDWTLEISINGRTPITVHAGECGMGGSQVRTKTISREEALRALSEGVKACAFCRPDSELGLLE